MPSTSPRPFTLLAWTILVLGLLLLGFMVVVEGEPGALPLALVALGGGGLVWARRRNATA